jgi:UDP-glucose-4-epimerase
MSILVTGGAGFIGSHTCVELLDHGCDVVVVDDLSNSWPGALTALRRLTERDFAFHEADLRVVGSLDEVFGSYDISAVIHFAAKKAVGESMSMPIEYFEANVSGTINLLRTMVEHDVRNLVFSSSCSIYGDQYRRPITENDPPRPVNPYAQSKLTCEQMLQAVCTAYPNFSAIALRYFNPAGAHPSGVIGECGRGAPSNVVPVMTKVAAGLGEKLQIFGSDYDTPDGTAIRDYIHVMDVAEAHRMALEHLDDQPGMRALNLGTGDGLSVLELVRTFEQACGVSVPFTITGRRPGDVASLVADSGLGARAWGWRQSRDVPSMFRDAWRFEQMNPDGFPDTLPEQREMKLTVIGTGYLGAVHAACMAELGHDVLGVDSDADKIAALASGRAPLFEAGLNDLLARGIDSGNLSFGTSLAAAAEFGQVHFICVGTPQLPGSLAADTSSVEAVIAGLGPRLTRPALVVGKSTVPVGTAGRLATRLAQLAPAGSAAELAWNPEFLREGYAIKDTLEPDRVVVGVTSAIAEATLRSVYAPLLQAGTPYIATDLSTAELAKVSANAFLATKISFINAMADICDAAGANITTLAEVLGHDTRIGHRGMAAGLGFGGGCLPKDVRALLARAAELGVADSVRFLHEIEIFNTARRRSVAELAAELCGGSLGSVHAAARHRVQARDR